MIKRVVDGVLGLTGFVRTPERGVVRRYGNVVRDGLFLCNFCGEINARTGADHSEGLSCSRCGAIARERVAYHCVLDRMQRRGAFVCNHPDLAGLRALEMSPRNTPVKRHLCHDTFAEYLTSDLEMGDFAADLRVDLTQPVDSDELGKFDVVLFAHVLEHIPDYRSALRNLGPLLSPDGFVVLQVPFVEQDTVAVTWDEFHGDDTRVHHRFGFDLIAELQEVFTVVQVFLGSLSFEVTSPEVAKTKYARFESGELSHTNIGSDVAKLYGLGNLELCDAVVLSGPVEADKPTSE